MKTLIATAAVITAFATPALADFFIVREGHRPLPNCRDPADRHQDRGHRQQGVQGPRRSRTRTEDRPQVVGNEEPLQEGGLFVGAILLAQPIMELVSSEHQSTKERSAKNTSYVIAVGAISILGLSWVALFNSSPLVFSDSIAYTTAALKGEVPGLFSVFYSYLIVPLHGGISLWPVVFAQAAMMAHLIHLVIRCSSDAVPSKSVTLFAIALLCLFSSLPWVIGQVMPDVFTSVLVLGIYLLAFCSYASVSYRAHLRCDFDCCRHHHPSQPRTDRHRPGHNLLGLAMGHPRTFDKCQAICDPDCRACRNRNRRYVRVSISFQLVNGS